MLQGMEEGVASVKAEVVDGVNKVQADVSETVTNGIEQVREEVCLLEISTHFQVTEGMASSVSQLTGEVDMLAGGLGLVDAEADGELMAEAEKVTKVL